MILSVGCSHTYGDDLEDKRSAWPFLLAEKMNTATINAAMSGGSNEYILSQIMEHTSHSDFNLIAIAWTYSERKTFWKTDNNHPVNFNINLTHAIYSDKLYFKNFGKLLYAHWMHELQNFKNWLQIILLTQSYLKHKKQPYVMLNSTFNNLHNFINQSWNEFDFFHQMNDEQIKKSQEEINHYVDQIDRSCYYEFMDYAIDEQFFATGPTGHFLEEGHRDTAERLYRFICSR